MLNRRQGSQLFGRRGVSLVELIVTMTILAILASVIMPMMQMTGTRSREIELHQNLRTIRTALDEFKKSYDKAITEKKMLQSANKSGYPETLQQLVDGYDFGGLYATKKKFLRRIPSDPTNPPRPGEEPKWGMRSYADKPDSSVWGGEDVYDVYSLSEGTAIDGTKYKDW
ncbi:type II secretion system protein [Geobacter sp. FeAm09]|uniref:type II secretion system protein n=1 Tax=Geobacter sp. FeAm09 TaxID=2597769 RepID=UPI0011ED2AC9|nr:type II secretion system protein [Geobacter sp. FeAm09]QEM67896.1 type II secretion system protein [Geobacter sp. FeAm09]